MEFDKIVQPILEVKDIDQAKLGIKEPIEIAKVSGQESWTMNVLKSVDRAAGTGNGKIFDPEWKRNLTAYIQGPIQLGIRQIGAAIEKKVKDPKELNKLAQDQIEPAKKVGLMRLSMVYNMMARSVNDWAVECKRQDLPRYRGLYPLLKQEVLNASFVYDCYLGNPIQDFELLTFKEGTKPNLEDLEKGAKGPTKAAPAKKKDDDAFKLTAEEKMELKRAKGGGDDILFGKKPMFADEEEPLDAEAKKKQREEMRKKLFISDDILGKLSKIDGKKKDPPKAEPPKPEPPKVEPPKPVEKPKPKPLFAFGGGGGDDDENDPDLIMLRKQKQKREARQKAEEEKKEKEAAEAAAKKVSDPPVAKEEPAKDPPKKEEPPKIPAEEAKKPEPEEAKKDMKPPPTPEAPAKTPKRKPGLKPIKKIIKTGEGSQTPSKGGGGKKPLPKPQPAKKSDIVATILGALSSILGMLTSFNFGAIRDKIPFDASNLLGMVIQGCKMAIGLILAAAMALIAGITQIVPKVQELISGGGGKPKPLGFRKKNSGGEDDGGDIGLENQLLEEVPDYEYPFDDGVKCSIF